MFNILLFFFCGLGYRVYWFFGLVRFFRGIGKDLFFYILWLRKERVIFLNENEVVLVKEG